MASIETFPFLRPSPGSVRVEQRLLAPTEDPEELNDRWSAGTEVSVEVSAEIDASFWSETEIGEDEAIELVAVADCLPARQRWIERSKFTPNGDTWEALCTVSSSGGVLAGELAVQAWIIGPGRTFTSGKSLDVHPRAKLWSSDPTVYTLDMQFDGFPTTAVSFMNTDRPRVPWLIEFTPGMEFHWSTNSSVRLLLNSDFPEAQQIAAGDAPVHLYQLIQADVFLGVVSQAEELSGISAVPPPNDQASLDHTSFAALAHFTAHQIGCSDLMEAITMVRNEPLRVIEQCREAAAFYQTEGAGA
ncbi:hypothetical protein MHY20_10520 [Helcobacillus sp. ACRRO]|uniref:hypothetical protein n=1 Tax=Helcobacillus sp. ACRRO TaxID=2918202 RepID=UPI001EF61AA2|nr:hypothetical protein [Helcobacillus sp. ACRRO]MCG7428029.1 hypothetical protein [Helcobacillus sp. ACRRO]